MNTAIIPFITASAEVPGTPQRSGGKNLASTVPTWTINPDLWLYRERTLALLKRYMRLAIEVGRLPSLLGREFFRTRLTAYRVMTFEDAVIFVHDVERCLERLDDIDQELIARMVFEHYTQEEAAGRMGCWRRTVARRLPDALDHLSDIFLEGGVLRRLP